MHADCMLDKLQALVHLTMHQVLSRMPMDTDPRHCVDTVLLNMFFFSLTFSYNKCFFQMYMNCVLGTLYMMIIYKEWHQQENV